MYKFVHLSSAVPPYPSMPNDTPQRYLVQGLLRSGGNFALVTEFDAGEFVAWLDYCTPPDARHRCPSALSSDLGQPIDFWIVPDQLVSFVHAPAVRRNIVAPATPGGGLIQ